MHSPKPPRLEFLRKLLPEDFSEEQIQAEEARLMRYIALVARIAKRIERDRMRTGKDSTQPASSSKMKSQ